MNIKNHDPNSGSFQVSCDVVYIEYGGDDLTDTMWAEFHDLNSSWNDYRIDCNKTDYLDIYFNEPFGIYASIYDSEYDDDFPMLDSNGLSSFTMSPDDLKKLAYEKYDKYGYRETFYEDFDVEVSLDGFYYDNDDPYGYEEYDIQVSAIISFHIIEDSVDFPRSIPKPKKPEFPKYNYSFKIFLQRNTPIKCIFFTWVVLLIFRLRLLMNE